MEPLHIVTPLWESQPLTSSLGESAFLKMEALQQTGSFKIRGIGYACQSSRDGGAPRLVSSSGRNAGNAVAYAGRRFGVHLGVHIGV